MATSIRGQRRGLSPGSLRSSGSVSGVPIVKDWNGNDVAVRRSRGGVLTFERWEDNVLRGDLNPWPPEQLLKQVRGYVGHRDHFDAEDADALAADLGRISKIQSINSEDAVTFSWFGTLAGAAADKRRAAVQWLYDRIGIDATAKDPVIDQWSRVFHPHAPGSANGPELDARIDDPDAALIYVEAKWRAAIGTGKGKAAGIRDDQIVLRRNSMRADPALEVDQRLFVVLGVSEHKPDLAAWVEPEGPARPVRVAWLTWNDLSACAAHPLAEEFSRFIAWKREAAANGR